jgi:uncharacterized protein YjaZ
MQHKHWFRVIPAIKEWHMTKQIPILLLLLCSVSLAVSQNVLNQDDVYVVDSLHSNRICFHRNMKLVDARLYSTIVRSIKLGIDTVCKVIALDSVEFRVLVFPERTIPRIGMSGAAPNGRQIYILLDPAHPKFNEAITIHIVQTIPHEYHHVLRYRTVGFGDNLFESMISEGLACHFALQVCKADTPDYCDALTVDQFKEWKAKAEKVWFEKEFDYLEWFVGLKKTIPAHAGYTIGFALVENYLKKHPQSSAASLYATPASAFLEK